MTACAGTPPCVVQAAGGMERSRGPRSAQLFSAARRAEKSGMRMTAIVR
jgi:hypothetical protein